MRIMVECDSVKKLMSSFIDSMVTVEEAQRVESHIATCEPCQRHLQSYVSVRNLVAGIESPPLPEDMILETRVKLSHARNKNFLIRLENRLKYILRPMVVPVLLGTSLTMLLFGILLGSLASESTVLAQSRVNEPPLYPLFQPVRTENANWIRFTSDDKQEFEEPLTIETHVDHDGRVIDYQILRGPENPEVDGWIRQLLSLARFTPATAFGKPVESRMILSFVAVRN
jgi:hypothetical protein